MHGASTAMGYAIADTLTFASGTIIVDVGGGDGTLLAQILEKNAGTSGILFKSYRENAKYCPIFQKHINAGIASVQNGSFFDIVPTGGQVYLFSRIFHDFDDESVQQILGVTRSVLQGYERLLS